MKTHLLSSVAAVPLLCSASYVEITPSTCTAYLATCPANSNLICGVGMGKDAGYTFIRGEDIDWMAEATVERCWAAGGVSTWHSRESFPYAGRIPTGFVNVDLEAITNMYFLAPPEKSDGLYRNGFVRPDFEPIVHDRDHTMAGEAILCTNAACLVNGTNSFDDVRVLFLPGKTFSADELPTNVNLTGAVDLFTVTNFYALVEDGTKFEKVATLVPLYYSYSDRTNRMTQSGSYVQKSWSVDYKRNSHEYEIDGGKREYYEGYTVITTRFSEVAYPSTETYLRAAASTTCEMLTLADSQLTYYGNFLGGTVHVDDPFLQDEIRNTDFPTSGAPFYVQWDLPTGRTDGSTGEGYGFFYNTNVETRAYLVAKWAYSESLRASGYGPDEASTNFVISSTNIYFLTVTDLGEMTRVTDRKDGSGNALEGIWRSEITSDRVTDNAYAFLDRMGYDLEDMMIRDPKSFPKSSFPATCPYENHKVGSCSMYTYLDKTLESTLDNMRLLLVVRPNWRAKVIMQ